MLQYLDPYQYLHVYLHTKNNHNTLENVRHLKSRNNFKLPPWAAAVPLEAPAHGGAAGG